MISKPRVAFAALAFFVGLASASCGGSAFTADDSANVDSGAPKDATTPSGDSAVPLPDVVTANDTGAPSTDTGAGPIPCPATQPTAQTACAPEGRECEYGSSPVQECDTVATCTNGAWSITMPTMSDKVCPQERDSACPATQAEAKGACTQQGVVCDYARLRCECAAGGSGSLPVQILDSSLTPAWRCQNPAQGCPILNGRPNLGSTCTTEGMSCDYGSCGAIVGGTTESCQGGVWQTQGVACPQ